MDNQQLTSLEQLLEQARDQQIQRKKRKPSAKPAPRAPRETLPQQQQATITNPWISESINLLVNRATCTNCGSIHVSPSESIYLEQRRKRFGSIERVLTAIPTLAEHEHLPRYIRERPVSLAFCQHCFTAIGDETNE